MLFVGARLLEVEEITTSPISYHPLFLQHPTVGALPSVTAAFCLPNPPKQSGVVATLFQRTQGSDYPFLDPTASKAGGTVRSFALNSLFLLGNICFRFSQIL